LKHTEKSNAGATSHEDAKDESPPVNGDAPSVLEEPIKDKDKQEQVEPNAPKPPNDAAEKSQDNSFVTKIAKGQSEAIAVRYV
jgi:hypothetical protein